MSAGENPALANASARSRRALSNTSERAPEWAWSSPATKIAAQLEKAPACAGGPAMNSAAASASGSAFSLRTRPRVPRSLVVRERRGQRRAGRLRQQPPVTVVELALSEGDGLTPAHHPPDAAHGPRHARPEEAGLHLQGRRNRGHARRHHAGDRHHLVQHGAEIAPLDLLHRV